MNIFLSYPSAHRHTATRLKLALEAEQHEVFFDRDDLGAGEAFHLAIREAVAAADLFVFLVAPESVAAGSYALAELEMARAKWRRPAGRVLPVVVAATPKASIPPYLMAVTLLEPVGEVVAETLFAVAALASPRRVRPWQRALAAVAMLAVLGASAWAYRLWDLRRTAAAEQAGQAEQAGRAARLCSEGSHADGFAQLSQLAALPGVAAAVLRAREDCAMGWLRVARVVGGEKTFAQFTAPLRPLLAQALVAGASGARAADLRAHLGWADALVWHDENSPAIDPTPHYRQALQHDADNVYGHAMWAHWMLLRHPIQPGPARQQFEAAVKTGRDTPFVRSLQLGASVTSHELGPYALSVLDQMRQRKEPLDAARKPRIWSYLYATAYREASARLLRESLPPQEALSTFLWLYPEGGPDPSQQALWRLVRGQLLVNAGRAQEARPDLLALQKTLRDERASGPLVDSVNRLLITP